MLKSLFDKVSELKAYIFIQKETPTQLFSVNIAKFLRTAFFIEDLLIIPFRKLYLMIDN